MRPVNVSFLLCFPLFKQLLSLHFVLISLSSLLHKCSLVPKFEFISLVPIQSIISICTGGTTWYRWCSILLSFTVSDTRNRTDTNVLIDEIISSEINECIIWLNWIFLCSFTKSLQLSNSDTLHGLEYFDKIIGLLLKLRVISESMELTIYSSGPARYLIVNNVNLLEFLLQLIVVSWLLGNHLLHL